MNSDSTAIRDATLRRIGRNVVNFARLERLLKLVVPTINVSGTASTIAENLTRGQRSADRTTLGGLINTLHGNLYSEDPDPSQLDPKEPRMRYSFRLEANPKYVEERQGALLQLMRERNSLIHSQLATMNFESHEECARLSSVLDEQNDRLRREIAELNGIRCADVDLMDELRRAFESDEFRTLFGLDSDGG